ncbi:MAG: HAMP domain-containing histidine kinase [Lachnospiraceae bacterium]|nr:HAMP domain-containing histidine kinase [Lachnospiraceae bacterium]
MTFALRYLREHMRLLLLELLFAAVFGIVFWLYRLPLSAVLYPAVICALLGSIFLFNSMYKAYKKHKLLTRLADLRGDVLKNELPIPAAAEESVYQSVIQKLCMEMQSMKEQHTETSQEMIDYFTIWVHQIKTPIASMRLNLEAEDTRLSQRLKSDLLHIEHYVEMVLTYLKMGAESTDYVFAPVSLDKIIRENLRKLRGDFIIKKLKLDYELVKETVISDEKWLSFVIEQLLSNALKYTGQGAIAIFSEAPKTLCIRDTGIGIAPQDLPRIFERGYTGVNGRRDKHASGLGLFLCREICKRLGAEISVTSRIEEGTTVKIDLSLMQNPMND